MDILVIGSKGFIGSNCFEYFKTGHTVYGSDVLTCVEENYIELDQENPDFEKLFSSQQYDICINCSGAASVPASLKNPLWDYELNTSNVFKILEAIRRYQPKCKFLNLSSAAVYGNPAKLPIAETDAILPVSPYGLHKQQAEQICSSFFNYWQISTCSLRIFSAYGPGLKKQLFWDLYQKSVGKNEIDLFGSGTETRDFIFIDDILQAIELVVTRAAFQGECINIANGEQVTIKIAAHIFYDALGWKGATRFIGEARKGDPLNWEADISKLKNFGYSPKFSLQNGLAAYAAWLKESV
jgi:UDP-glucose 4-epimerase